MKKSLAGLKCRMSMKALGAAFVSVGAFAASWADSRIGDFDYGTFTGDVSGFVWQDPFSLGFDKVGSGAATLQMDGTLRGSKAEIGVRQGRLNLVEGGDEPDQSLPDAFYKASLWLEAGSNLVMNAAGTGVSRWLDVRESSLDGAEYPSAVAPEGGCPEVREDSDGMKSLHFGGSLKSGCTMRFDAAGRTTVNELDGLRHVFVVTKVENVFGFVLGANSASDGYSCCFHPGSSSGTLSQTYQSRNEAHRSGLSGRFYRDGVMFNAYGTFVSAGTQVLEWESVTETAAAGNFFNDRNIDNRCGGDDICEVVFFTNRLSVVERCRVGEYLLRKWKGAAPSAVPSISTAAGAEVSIGSLASQPAVSGEGVIVADSSSVKPVRFFPSDGFIGSVKAAPGATIEVSSADLPYSFSDGERVTAYTDKFDALVVTSVADGESGTARIDSDAESVRVCGFSGAVSNLAVSGCGLVLSAPRGSECKTRLLMADQVDAVIPNPGFEETDTPTKSISKSDTWQEYLGWRFFVPSGITASGVYILDRTIATWPCPHDAPEGSFAMGLKGGADCAVDVTFPQKGRYDLTFMTSGRSGASYDGGIYDIALAKDGVTNVFARVVTYCRDGYAPQRFRTPEVEAGEYELVFTHVLEHDYVAMFDDFRLRLVRDEETADVVPVPNGDFERCTLSASYGKAVSRNNTAEKWTFTHGGNGVSGDPSVAVGTIGMGGDWFAAGSSRGGNIQLVFWENGGSAVSDAFTTLPAGRWRLRCRASRWGRGRFWHNVMPTSVPVMQASVTVNGTPADLGTVTVENTWLSEITFPEVIAVPQGASVSLSVAQTAELSCAIIDDLEFVSAETDELCADGSFEQYTTAWTLVNHNDGTENLKMSAAAIQGLTGDNQKKHFGVSLADGGKALKLVDFGEAYQSIDFPEGGLYRLSFWGRGRLGDGNTRAYAGNIVRAYLTGDNGFTNEIIRTGALCCTNFVEYTACFKVPSAGDYNLHFRGLNDGSGAIKSVTGKTSDLNALVDAVSVRKVADAAALPDIPGNAVIEITGDGKLRLDYDGTLTLKRLKVGGARRSGIINAERLPGIVCGPGSLYVPPSGLSLVIR